MKDLSLEELEVLLCSTGYLPPRNEDELTFFNQMYEDYDSKLAGKHVDVEAIINGKCCVVSYPSLAYEGVEWQDLMAAEESSDYYMAARNYRNLPKEVLEKMRHQHKSQKDNED